MQATRSQIFQSYNEAKRLVRQGRLDHGRVNRALGIAQSKAAETHIERYGTTASDCHCPDHRYRGIPCKGIIALAIRDAAL